MKVLVACEFSGIVRDAFLERGHDAWSCDLLPSETNPDRHFQANILDLLDETLDWDLMIAHPPCTRLCNSGVRWLHERNLWYDLDRACELFSDLWNTPIPRICIENPVMHRHAKVRIYNYRPPAQTIQPWQFGHGETKRTCLWLRGLKPLVPTDIVEGREQRIHMMPPSENRGHERSRFYTGIAKAMADQWR